MKKLFIAFVAAAFSAVAAMAADKATGLRLTMQDESKGYIEIIFTDSPVLSHNEDASQVIITYDGSKTVTFPVADLAKMTFVEIEETNTGLEAIIPSAENAPKGIYTLQGTRVEKVEKGNVYIINGKKVLVK